MTNNTPKVARAMQHLDENMVLNSSYAPKRRRATPWAALAACLAVVVIATSVVPNFFGTAAVETVVALDVNPSMEITVDKDEDVIEVIPLNEDARIVIGDMDFDNVDLDVAVNALVGSMLKNGYLTIDRNSILVSVQSRDETKAAALQAKLSDEVSRLLSGSNIEASVLTQSFTKPETAQPETAQSAISPAKDALLKKIVATGITDAKGQPYTYDHLAALSVHELKQLVESRAMTVDNVTSTGTANTNNYIGKDKAITAALGHAGFDQSDVSFTEWELDHENGQMVYNVEFNHNGLEYEYDINAVTGEIVFYTSEPEWDIPSSSGTGNPASPGTTNTDNYIGKDKAISAALSHAGLNASDVSYTEWELDHENGQMVYSVEFYHNGLEYTYDVNAVTGEITVHYTEVENDPHDDWDDRYDHDPDDKYDDWDDKYDDDRDDDRDDDWDDDDDDDDRRERRLNTASTTPSKPTAPPEPAPSKPTTSPEPAATGTSEKDAAVNTALEKAGLSQKDVRDLDYDKDIENGRQVQEVSFESNGVEYEVTIDAATGEVLRSESERDD